MVEKVLQLNREKTMFWSLIGILFICSAFYIYSINVTIRNVVVRQELENKAAQLTLKIGSQEFKYITMRNSITLPMAYSLGFGDVKNKIFVSRNSTSYVSYLPR